MLKKLSIILASIIFGLVLSFFAWKGEYYFYALGFLVIFTLSTVWPIARKLRFLAMPFFLSIGALNLLYLVDGLYERVLFIVLAVVIYWMSLWGASRLKKYDCDQTAQGMINLATIITVFFWLVSTYGWYLNFNISSWALIIITVVSIFLITLPSLTISFIACHKVSYRQKKFKNHKLTKKSKFLLALQQQIKIKRTALFFSFVIAFIMGEIIWGLTFWSFGYLTTGMTAVIIFFLFWSVVRKFIKKELTKKFVIFNVLIMLAMIGLMIITSPWDII